jgi:hypothetical protein
LNLAPKNSGVSFRLQHHKNQAVHHMNSVLYLFPAYVLNSLYACPLRASKIFTLSFMVQIKQLGAASQGECIR